MKRPAMGTSPPTSPVTLALAGKVFSESQKSPVTVPRSGTQMSGLPGSSSPAANKACPAQLC